jgi:hypothetical protein
MVDTSRAKRLSAVLAGEKIQSVLQWESMPRSHPTYKAVEAAINAEFDRERKNKKAKTDEIVPIEYDEMSDSSEELGDTVSDPYEPCDDSVDSAEEEETRYESSVCSSSAESSQGVEDSDLSLVDFSEEDDDDTEDEHEQQYDDEDEDDVESISSVVEAVSVVQDDPIAANWQQEVFNTQEQELSQIDEYEADRLFTTVHVPDVVSGPDSMQILLSGVLYTGVHEAADHGAEDALLCDAGIEQFRCSE